MTTDVVPFSSAPQSSMAVEANKASIARTVDHEITMCLERIEEYAKQLWRQLARMRDEELWRELGFPTYRDYLKTVSERSSQVPKQLRGPIRKQLEAEGASTREIAAATGTTKQTVINDRNRERVIERPQDIHPEPPLPRSDPTAIAELTAARRAQNAEIIETLGVSEIVDAEVVNEPYPWHDTVVRLEGILAYIKDEAPPEIRVDVSKMLRREADRMDPRKPRNHETGRMTA